MINPRISAVWITTKSISPFSCTRRVQEVHTKGQVVHLRAGLFGLGYRRTGFDCDNPLNANANLFLSSQSFERNPFVKH